TPTPSSTPSPPHTPTSTPTPALPMGFVLKDANLRSGPGIVYPVIGLVAKGQQVALQARNRAGDWILLDMGGEGQEWVAAFLLDLPIGIELPIAQNIPTPPPTPTPGDVVRLGQTSITLPTYPWETHTTWAYDETTAWRYRRFDRGAYEASDPRPTAKTYNLITLENRWLKITILPDLGGRIYQMIFKPTGSNELYQNPVIKPSPWGPVEQGGGWLAAGGIEWALPVPEHGYAWGEPWGYITEPGVADAGVTVFDHVQDALHLSVDVGLQPDSAAMTLDFRLENLGAAAVNASFWSNAMLAPGPANTVGPEVRFIYPGDYMQVHSTGEADMPGPGGVFDWPIFQGRDVSRLGTWGRWLGFFAYPQAQAGWAAVYDMAADEGVVRVFDPAQTPGLKGFGFGWADPIPPDNYTDDGSAYVEMHGGLPRTFDERVRFEPGQRRVWREVWYPVAGVRGVRSANAGGAANLTQEADGLHLRLFSVSSRRGQLRVQDAAGATFRMELAMDPARPADILLPAMQLPLDVRFFDVQGQVWALTVE
ncbi:MAG: DUF5107 domain-containing protein, partial [Chloroflexi bacterium]|nr:DUF5107 domain-containing protein [Chloroflexota bacterium]